MIYVLHVFYVRNWYEILDTS